MEDKPSTATVSVADVLESALSVAADMAVSIALASFYRDGNSQGDTGCGKSVVWTRIFIFDYCDGGE